MPDTRKLRRKILLNILASPLTAAPFLAGVTALVGAWALGVSPAVGVFAGLAGALSSAGVFVTKLVLGGEAHAKRAIEEMQAEAQAERERALDDLEQRLIADGDPRTEAALRDMRSLTRALKELGEDATARLNTLSAFDIVSGAERLFEQCVRSLEQTLRLWHTAQKMTTKAARDPIVRQREEILRDVGRSIRQLGDILVAVQKLDSGEGAESELMRIGEELGQHLAVAKQVEQRVRAFESQLRAEGRE